jgi:hypothetical protein
MATVPLTPAEEQAGVDAFTAWANPEIANASWASRSYIKEYFAAHEQMIIEVVGPAIIAAHDAAKGDGST